ncbi:hypothetical protein [Prosthecochloris sp. SCSIO W1103]|uniref:Uncharacterized protein n=2 Tax=Chlorobiaceae TaxID=191412 RepID=A0A317T989_9CHLB|nr:hypothetical protein [Prosthecochloris sp. SCSIO W1103]PWW83303.1 hypothetical protein CR164_01755 [Prosthecochloris marina]UZJ36503.1 hypothetical protein OO005_06950 [Prosthecochloris sp. SCSIO W1103]
MQKNGTYVQKKRSIAVSTEKKEYTKKQIMLVLEDLLNKYISDTTFRRWKNAVGIQTKARYTQFDLFRLWFIGDYMNDDRSLNRATNALERKLHKLKEKHLSQPKNKCHD